MNQKELKHYCKEKGIRPEFVAELKAQGISRANGLYKKICEQEALLKKIGEVLLEAEKMRGAYFFTPPTSASLRRSYERYHSKGPVEWEEGGNSYFARISVSCSCRRVYCYTYYYVNDDVTNLTKVRNSYNRLYKEFYLGN